MYYNRHIDSVLYKWKSDSDRKPLLIRGARQVGKSAAVKNLGKSFDHFIEINFEIDQSFSRVFNQNLDPSRIVEDLSLLIGRPIVSNKTLLFFDEIQYCPEAISSLRYFYEKMPDLHVVAAGSLLEFALSSLPSFGVGRLRSVFMYPFSFDEFLEAIGEKQLLEAKKMANFEKPLSPTIHEKLIDLLRKFMVVGGMPQSVSSYVKTKQMLTSMSMLDDLQISLRDDFVKYKNKVPSTRIAEVFESVIKQIGGKFIYTKASTQSSLYHIKEALDLLILAGVVIPVTHTAANGLPLGAEIDLKKRKMLLLDTGIFQRLLGLDLSNFLLEPLQKTINNGAIAELFWGLECLKYSSPFSSTPLYYWHRESANANAEVDYIIHRRNGIIPIEIKASTTGSMQSLRLFMTEKYTEFGYRFSLENFAEVGNIRVIPLYAVSSFLEGRC
jgi:uncharacterized protein